MNKALSASIKHLPHPLAHWQTWYVAYSGGLDSTVLLHFLQQQGLSVHAIHVNHQLQPGVDELTVAHCAAQCHSLGIPFTLKTVVVKKNKGENIKAVGRAVRYAVLAEFLDENSLVCMAHHQDDQAETLLLQLLRGSGVAGLAAMSVLSPLGKSYLFRPLLSLTRKELHEYALVNGLKWMDDPSNENTDYDRNYLRHEVMPVLKKRWPSAAQTLSRSAEHCAEVADSVAEMAAQDYARIQDKNTLSISQCLLLPEARQKHVLRYWIAQQGFVLPSAAQLQQVCQQLQCREDAQPLIQWAGIEVRRHHDDLHVGPYQKTLDLSDMTLSWDLKTPLMLPGKLGRLEVQSVQGPGLSKDKLSEAPVSIRFRVGSERCQPVGRAHSQTLKKLFQEYRIPSWKRSQVPLLYCGDVLAAALGYWVCAPFEAKKEESAIQITLLD